MHVLGTAGHVDHGKTSLLRFLTGMEPSRLEEERKRGMTIQLGFVWMKLPNQVENGELVGIVDVPGHKDFRTTMMMGAGGIDAFIFIVAADDGWMAQSEEHLWTLKSLGVSTGIVVITKTDLVTDERVKSLKDELEFKFFEAFEKEFLVYTFSASTKLGGEELHQGIFDLISHLPKNLDLGRPYLFFDRVFTLPGQGTIVTGTLRDGVLAEKEKVEVLPNKTASTIRSIQCYGTPIKKAVPTTRVALQLSDISKDALSKGCQIAKAGHSFLTTQVDIKAAAFPAAPINKKQARQVLTVHGGIRTPGKMIYIGQADDGSHFLRLRLDIPRWLRFGDPIIILSSGGDHVFAGGRVADTSPGKGIEKARKLLSIVQGYTLFEYLSMNLSRAYWVEVRRLRTETIFSLGDLSQQIESSVQHFFIEDIGASGSLDHAWISDEKQFGLFLDKLHQIVGDFHKANPFVDSMPKQKLKDLTGCSDKVLEYALKQLFKQNRLIQISTEVKWPAHKMSLREDSPFMQELAKISKAVDPIIISLKELCGQKQPDRAEKAALDKFIKEQKVIRLDEDSIFSFVAFQNISTSVLKFLEQKGEATTAEIRDHINLGRKQTILILEYMDRARLTYRQNDVRKLMKK